MPFEDTLLINPNDLGVMDGQDPAGEGVSGSAPVNTVYSFDFCHSLWQYEDPLGHQTPLTRGGEWMGRLAIASGTTYAGARRFGQYFNHVGQYPPAVSDYANNTESLGSSFVDAPLTHCLVMPSNYFGVDMSAVFPYSDDGTTSTAAFGELYDLIKADHPSATVVLFIHEPDAGNFGGDVLTTEQRDAYISAATIEFRQWYERNQAAILASGRTEFITCPAGLIMYELWRDAPFMTGVAFNQMHGDSAPHGYEPVYLIKAMVVYRQLFRQNPNVNALDLSGATQLIPEVADNLPAIRDFIEARLDYWSVNGLRVYPENLSEP